MNTLEAIKQSLRLAKWQDQLDAMAYADLCLDMYNFEQDIISRKVISEMFPNTGKDLCQFKEDFPLTSDLINKLALLFKQPPVISLDFGKDANEQPLNQDTVDLFTEELVNKPMLNLMLLNTQRYVNLLGKVGLMPRWYDRKKKLEYYLIHRGNCFVLQDKDSPSNALAVAYRVNPLQDTYVATKQINRYEMWTDEEKSLVEINNGVPKVITSEPNPYKVIPIVWFDNVVQYDDFWREGKNPIIEANKAYNWKRALINLQIAYQTYSTLVTENYNATGEIKVGCTAYLNLQSDKIGGDLAKAYYITPDPKLELVLNTIEQFIDRLANSQGLSTAAFRQSTDFPSGYALKLSMTDIIDRNKLEKPIYTQAIKELMQTAVIVYNNDSDKQIRADGANYIVDIAEVTVDVDPIEKNRDRAMQKSLGIASSIDFIIEDNPDLTREQAIEKFERIKQENSLYVSNADEIGKELGVNDNQ